MIDDYSNRKGFIWLNGEFVEWPKARIHVLSHGLHYASCVFEGIRIYHGKPFKLAEHMERFSRSAELLGFKLPYDKNALVKVCLETVAKQNIKEGYLRPVSWLGSEQMAISASRASVNVAVAAWGWASYFDPAIKRKGVRLALSNWLRPSPRTAPNQAKAAGLYMICTLSKHAAEEKGFDDALMLDYKNRLAEATGANLFWVKGGKLFTPPPGCILNGITRLTVMELARAENIPVVEEHGALDDLKAADEAFLTGTAVEITPIAEVEGQKFQVGEITKRLIEKYERLVAE